MNRDRLSAWNACYNASSFDDAISFEYENAKHVIQQESVKGTYVGTCMSHGVSQRYVRGYVTWRESKVRTRVCHMA